MSDTILYTSPWLWGGLACSLLLAAIFAAGEYSLIRIRFSHFDRELTDPLEKMPKVTAFIDLGDRATFLLRAASIACGWISALLLFPVVLSLLFGVPVANNAFFAAALVLVAFLLVLFLHLLLVDQLGRLLGMAQPLFALRLAIIVFQPFSLLLGPWSSAVQWLSTIFWTKISPGSPVGMESLDIDAQLALANKDAPDLSTVAQLIFKNAMLMRDLVVADVLLPRNQVRYFDLNQSLQVNLAMAKESGHTRFPLCFGDLDHCVGLIHIKDLFRYRGDLERLDLRKIKRNMIRLDGDEPLESALTKLLSHRMHMALVIDEFNGTEGVLTLERILEQLVGEIRDEFDADEEALIRTDLESDQVLVSGLTPLHEIETLMDCDFDNDEVSTIGGLVTSVLGRIPDKGEAIPIADIEVLVTEVEDTRVLQVRLMRQPAKNSDLPNGAPAK